MRKLKLSIYTTLCILLFFNKIHAQQIAPLLFGQNAWVPTLYYGNTSYGRLDFHWDDLRASACNLIQWVEKGIILIKQIRLNTFGL
jgi:hypothetical protein